MEYVMWWISVNPAGMLFALWLSAKREPSQRMITPDELERRFQSKDGQMDMRSLERAAQTLGVLSQPDSAGNGEAPVGGGRKQRRGPPLPLRLRALRERVRACRPRREQSPMSGGRFRYVAERHT